MKWSKILPKGINANVFQMGVAEWEGKCKYQYFLEIETDFGLSQVN